MKSSAWLLIFSLAANGALVAALTLRTPASRPASVAARADGSSPAAVAAVSPAHAPAAKVNIPVANLWSRLHSDNLDDLKHRLQAAGFPPKHIRMLLSLEIQDRMNAEREALIGKQENIPYWKNQTRWPTTPEEQKRLLEHYRQARALEYQYVSGPDSLVDDEEARNSARRRFGNLPLGKLQQLTTLQRDAEDLRLQLQAATSNNNAMDREAQRAAQETYQALEKEKMAQVAQLLTPAELEQYELHSDQAAFLSARLSAFRPTEDEFKLLYALEKSSREAAADKTLTSAQQAARREEQEAVLLATLGPERADDYEAVRRGGDQLPSLIARLELPLSTIGAINTVRTDINQRAQAIAKDPQLTAAQRNSQLVSLAAEANEKLTATLGSKRGYDAYMEMKGDWVRELQTKK
jgi:hypothetical protein